LCEKYFLTTLCIQYYSLDKRISLEINLIVNFQNQRTI